MAFAGRRVDCGVGGSPFPRRGFCPPLGSYLAIALEALDEAVLAALEGGEAWFPAAGNAEILGHQPTSARSSRTWRSIISSGQRRD
jgi:hypothetical protein